MRKGSGKSFAKEVGSPAWIRFDDGFSVRACRLVELSSKGVRIVVESPQGVTDNFFLLLSRDAAPGRRCRIRARSGTEIDAEFVVAKASVAES